MTSTPHVTGFGDNAKPCSKVLRPPGGGTSDIFGSDSQIQTPRTVRNHMQSNIFGNNDQQNAVKNNGGDSVRRSQKNIDSYSRLFGEPERPTTPAKNHMKSSIPIGPNAATTETNGSSSSQSSVAAPVNGHTRNGNKMENGGGDHQNGITKTEPESFELNTNNAIDNPESIVLENILEDPENETELSSSINDLLLSSNKEETIEFSSLDGGGTNTANNNNNTADFTSYEVNTPRCNGIIEIKSPLQQNHYNNNRNNNMNGQITNNLSTTSKILLNGNGGRNSNNSNNNENDSSSSSNMNSSLISPASTATTTSSSKYGGSNFSSAKYMTRNPITGLGIEEPVRRQRRNMRRDGNPVTGEGYKSAGAEINTSVPALNGANQVIIKNRIPPGGYSSGLW